MAMALGVTASAYAANPFSDVPAGHWAYDSVAKLAAAGVVDGYADGAFDGDKLMTRYEMAQIVAKAMAKGADCDKLAAEFADELDTLGVRVAKLEKGADNVKISGETRLRYWNSDNNDGDKTQLRTRIWIKGQVNEDWTATAMLENVQDLGGIWEDEGGEETTNMQRAYVNGKVGGLAVQAGRYSFCDFNGGIVYDHRMDGVQVSYGKDVQLTAGFGQASSGAKDDMAYAKVATKFGMVDAAVDYYKFDKGTTKQPGEVELYNVSAALPLAKDLKLTGIYMINESEVADADDGYVVALNYKKASAAKPGSWALWAKYYDQPVGTAVDPTWESSYEPFAEGWTGYGVGLDYAVAKNMVAQVKYYEIEGEVSGDEVGTLYAQLNVSF